MTLMRDSSAFHAYPFERLDAQTLNAMKQHCQTQFEHVAIGRLCLSLECFLQVTQQSLSFPALGSSESDPLLTSFIGALSSPLFRNLSVSRTYSLAMVLKNVLTRLRSQFDSPPFLLYQSPKLRAVDFERARVEFEHLTLCEEKIWYWTGWSCISSTGNVINLPLLPIYQKLGRAFTTRLHDLCINFAITRRAPIVRPITYMSRFVACPEFNFCPSVLQERQGSADFFNEFWRHFYKGCIHDGSKHTYAVESWRNQILPFIKEQLLPSGLFAPSSKLPAPQPAKNKGEYTHVRGPEGEQFKDKLLIHVPLHLSDEEAFQVIRARLYEADNLAVRWCDAKIAAAMQAYERASEWAKTGIPIRCEYAPKRSVDGGRHTSPDNPLLLNNLAATLRVNGFGALIRAKRNRRLKIKDLGKTLALPLSETLLAFCLKLIRLHPQITPSFLNSVELFDRNGKRVGKKTGDTCNYLLGYKDRKQATSSQMQVKLTTESEKLVEFLALMTAPLRAYLKTQNDDAWRRLLLTCKSGFGRPSPYACKVQLTPKMLTTLRDELMALHPQSHALIPELAHSLLRPSTMRSTAAVLVFFETSSVYRMAQALGHNAYTPDLLLRYLPSSLLHFYRDRWVRVFQTGIIVQAMVDSPLLLQATGFDSALKLDAFLEHHVLTIPRPQDAASIATDRLGDRTFICLSIVTLRILLTLHVLSGTDPGRLNGKARHWAEFTQHLLTYLESDAENSLEWLDMVQAARSQGPINFKRGVVYEQ